MNDLKKFTAFQVLPTGEIYEKEFLSVVASVESLSSHPFAEKVVETAKKNNYPLYPVVGFKEFPGEGVGGAVEVRPSLYRAVIIGKKEFLRVCGLEIPDILEVTSRKWSDEGATLSYAGWDGWVRGILKFNEC